MRTDDFIRTIAGEARPVRRLPPPASRIALWLAVALPAVLAIVLLMSPRADLAEKLADTRFQIEQLAAFVTAIAAGYAAFSMVVPGRSRWTALLPLPPLALWLGSLGESCIQDWIRAGPEGLRLEWDWVCIPSIALVGLVPAAAMVMMLRRGAPLAPSATLALGALAAAALGNFGLRLFHPQDASLMVLVWQFGTVALIAAVAGCTGRHVLRWPRLSPTS